MENNCSLNIKPLNKKSLSRDNSKTNLKKTKQKREKLNLKDVFIYSWGKNKNGELGIGTSVNANIPTPITSLNTKNIISVKPGGRNTLLIKEDGNIYLCGSNIFGLLALNNDTQTNTLFKIEEERTLRKNDRTNKNVTSTLNDVNNLKSDNINSNEQIKKLDKSKIKIFDSSKNPQNSNIASKAENSLYINDEQNIFLQGKNISKSSSNNYNSDKFCECFFLASFPKENGKIIPNTESLPSDCEHDICSCLPAMEPNILYKYPEDIKQLEINSLAASICFPNGIKLCYEEDEEKINMLKNYRSTLTNQGGQMYFIYTFHFYLKMANVEFINIYKMHPIKYQLTTYQDELGSTFTEEQGEDIVKN